MENENTPELNQEAAQNQDNSDTPKTYTAEEYEELREKYNASTKEAQKLSWISKVAVDNTKFIKLYNSDKRQAEEVAKHFGRSAKELYETCQFISLHIPATAETKNSINYALLERMPKNAVLVNTARKEVINEVELIKLMEDRADFRYVTDIMPAANAEFAAQFPTRYFSTPKKMGAQTAEANINAGIAAAKQIVGFIRDGVNRFQVNK